MSKNKNTEHKISSGIFSLLLKQTISGIICFAIVFAMNASDNAKIKNYATSLGYALRAEFDFDSAMSQFMEHIPFFDNTDQPQNEGIFQ